MLAVALSGGVDSAVAAARLHTRQLPLIGVTARLLPPECSAERGCCDAANARELCALLGIEHYLIDLAEEFAADIIAPFLQSYASGLTPNPCLPCNRTIKFGALFERVRRLGCEGLATGHYVVRGERAGRPGLRQAADLAKDQSYMLMGLAPEQVMCAQFPLGNLGKADVVAEAQRLHLPFSQRESQDVCFIPRRLADYLREYLDLTPGPVLDLRGREIGTHQGLALYTVGQRQGLNIASGARLFVLHKDPARNALIVGERGDLAVRELTVRAVNWVSVDPPEVGGEIACRVMVRYRGVPIAGVVRVLEGDACRVRLAPHEQAIAPGQGAAFYDEAGWLLGGGTIAGARGTAGT